ncbi:MAG: hypothetical protein LC645_03795 [Geobacteraceae bacterium]|nr:hypothetical protein [Geobacteraceae bacterium]
MKNFSFTVSVLLATVLLSVSAFAGVVEKVEDDFAPASGVVVMPTGSDEYIVDLDGSNGVVVGDLLAVKRSRTILLPPPAW